MRMCNAPPNDKYEKNEKNRTYMNMNKEWQKRQRK